jgi:cyclopropane fatty-acyl-phospholipid synthase-like methyltransferase
MALDSVINNIKLALNKQTLRMLDIPCGDMVWMSVFLANRPDIVYTGMDIVPDLIRRHTQKYAERLNWQFELHDIVAEPLSASYDLIFSRDMTQHLTTGDTLRVLNHFSISGSAFAMLTTYPTSNNSKELDLTNKIDSMRYFEQNLESPPYSLIHPMCVRTSIAEQVAIEYTALWQLPLTQHHRRPRN